MRRHLIIKSIKTALYLLSIKGFYYNYQIPWNLPTTLTTGTIFFFFVSPYIILGLVCLFTQGYCLTGYSTAFECLLLAVWPPDSGQSHQPLGKSQEIDRYLEPVCDGPFQSTKKILKLSNYFKKLFLTPSSSLFHQLHHHHSVFSALTPSFRYLKIFVIASLQKFPSFWLCELS